MYLRNQRAQREKYSSSPERHQLTENEKVYMRPSNNFAEVSEVQFNKKEQEKALLRLELQEQIELQRRRKEAARLQQARED